jgi:hypothetical protein
VLWSMQDTADSGIFDSLAVTGWVAGEPCHVGNPLRTFKSAVWGSLTVPAFRGAASVWALFWARKQPLFSSFK